ncbi:MAG: restriction endonuclease subunit S [Methylococcus sp.]
MKETLRPGYKQTEVGVIPEDWSTNTLGKVATLQRGFDLPHRLRKPGTIPIVTSSGIEATHSEAKVKAPGVVTGRYGTIGEVFFVQEDFWPLNTTLYIREFHGNDPLFISYFLRTIDFHSHSGKSGVPGVNRNDLHEIVIAYPPEKIEQRAIAAALSDVDALLTKLDQLIAKKRDLKQAAMQQLLTGQTRLPGFSGAWEVKLFSEVLFRVNGKAHQIQSSDYQESGNYPVVDQGKQPVIGFSDRADKVFHCPSGGVIVFGDHTCIVKFVDFEFVVGADGTQIMAAKDGQSARFHAYQLEYSGISTTGYNRHFKFVKEREFVAPTSEEQTAIATILSDMDAEIAALEARRDKTRVLQQGMRQELLTGRIRLVDPVPSSTSGSPPC